MILQVVIRLAYTAISEFIEYLDKREVRYVVGEHEADEETTQTHCHLAIDWNMTRQALEKGMKSTSVSGRAISSIMEKTHKTREAYDFDILTTYITKGKISNIKKYRGLTEDQIAALAAKWVTPTSPGTLGDPKVSKEIKDRTRWQVVQDVITETQKMPGVWETVYQDPFGASADTPSLRIKSHQTVFKVMLKHLRENKISTSRNELERMYVTIIRHDPYASNELYESIYKNIFRSP